MTENVWRNAVLILLLLGFALGLFSYCGIPLGLDLRGGARLVYRLDIDRAREEGQIDPELPEQALLQDTIDILISRIDPQGTLEASIMAQGSDRILIEIPGRQETEVALVRSRITQLGSLEFRLVIDEAMTRTFDIAEERRRLREWLERPENQTLVGRDPEEISVFNALPTDRGGPNRLGKIRWVPMDENADSHGDREFSLPMRWNDPSGVAREGLARFMPVSLEAQHFTGDDLQSGQIRQTRDEKTGFPAVAFQMNPAKQADFAEFTAENRGRAFAIILNNRVRSAPTIQSRIAGRGQISGGSRGFSPEELRTLILTLKTGSLQIRPELESESTIGPTVGETAIRTGTTSMIIGGIAVVLFMLLYYRKVGTIAVLALVSNVLLLLGAMASFRFTLTLPGLAGLVLSIGMAVDANILIFERIREELEKGKVLVQAVKNGFQFALSTIVDANLTTLITALVLYQVGTGPIKGFAITLSVGILTSMFAALIISRVLFGLYITTGFLKQASMTRVFKDPKYAFLALRKPAFAISALLMLLGFALFLVTDRNTKLGIDFTGGVAMRIGLKEPQGINTVRNRITEVIPGAIVNTLGGSVVQEGGALAHIQGAAAQSFAVKFKESEGAEKDALEIGDYYREKLREALGDWLISPPYSNFRIWEGTDQTYALVQFQIHFDQSVRLDELREALRGLDQLDVSHVPGPGIDPEKPPDSVRNALVSIAMESGVRESQIPDRISRRLAEVKSVEGTPLALTEPFPEFELIGPRVVGELQARAFLAVALSLIAVIMYIRVRFHEFRFGIAAVIALVHDICIALGVITLVNRLGLVSAEIDLPQIAAFLTIIGYSLNDTIVVFDRIRENLPRMQGSYEEIINHSINQTLARTIWTSGTTLAVLFTILIMNYGQGSVLEGFSFTMIIGILVGTYSSIFIASPVLAMFHHLDQGKEPALEAKKT